MCNVHQRKSYCGNARERCRPIIIIIIIICIVLGRRTYTRAVRFYLFPTYTRNSYVGLEKKSSRSNIRCTIHDKKRKKNFEIHVVTHIVEVKSNKILVTTQTRFFLVFIRILKITTRLHTKHHTCRSEKNFLCTYVYIYLYLGCTRLRVVYDFPDIEQ